MKKGILITIVILLIIWIGTGLQNTNHDTNETITIGAVISETGVAAAFGEMAQMGIYMAVEEINAGGGINGQQVEVVIENDETSATKALTAMQKLISVDKVDGIVGSIFDFVSQPMLVKAEEYQIPLINPANFRIPDAFEMNDYTFVLYPDFEKILRNLTYVFESEPDIENVAIVRFQSEFGSEIERVIEDILIETNRPEITTEVYAEIGNTDFRTPILKLREKEIDTVFLDALDIDIVAFIKTAKEMDFNPKYITYTTLRDAVSNPDVNKELLEDVIMLDWEVPSPEFTEKFMERYNTLPIKSANKAYNAVYVLANALGKNPENPVQWMEQNTVTTADAVIQFSNNHSVITSPVKIWRIEEGEFVEIYHQD